MDVACPHATGSAFGNTQGPGAGKPITPPLPTRPHPPTTEAQRTPGVGIGGSEYLGEALTPQCGGQGGAGRSQGDADGEAVEGVHP